MRQPDLAHRLASAYAVDPPAGFSIADERVRRAMSIPDGRRLRPRGRAGLVLGLAAALLLAGAATGAITILERIAGFTPGTQAAWDGGVDIGQRQVHGDFSVTLVRGYADVDRVLLGLSVERVGKGTTGDAPGLEVELRDPAGVVLTAGPVPALGAIGESSRTDEVVSFGPTTKAKGDYTLRLGFSPAKEHADLPWTFTFQLPAPLGAVVRLDQTKAVGGASVEVGTLRLSPSLLTAVVHVDPGASDATGWGVMGAFHHGSYSAPIDWNTRGSTDQDLTAGTNSGLKDASGKWTLTITELVGDRPDGSQVRLQGPWEFTFEVPEPAGGGS